MPFESFAADDPNQIVLGLFSDELLAVYLLVQVQPNIFDCHFTSRKDAPKEAVLAAGRQIVGFCAENGLELVALVPKRSKPLQAWVEGVGFELGRETDYSGVPYLCYEIRKDLDRANFRGGETFHQIQDGAVNPIGPQR